MNIGAENVKRNLSALSSVVMIYAALTVMTGALSD